MFAGCDDSLTLTLRRPPRLAGDQHDDRMRKEQSGCGSGREGQGRRQGGSAGSGGERAGGQGGRGARGGGQGGACKAEKP